MFAVVVREAGDAAKIDGSAGMVSANVAPRVREAPGFVSALWMSDRAGKTLNVLVFSSEEAARAGLEAARSYAPTAVHERGVRRRVQRARKRIGERRGTYLPSRQHPTRLPDCGVPLLAIPTALVDRPDPYAICGGSRLKPKNATSPQFAPIWVECEAGPRALRWSPARRP